MVKKTLVGCVLAVAAVALTGCGSSGSPSAASARTPSASITPSPSPSAIDYGQQYLADVAPSNRALDAFGRVRTNGQNIRADTRLSNIEQTTAAKMLRQTWPANAKADIDALAEAFSVESGDDAGLAEDFKIDPTAHRFADGKVTFNLNASSMADDLDRDNADSNKTTALAQKCRADLGLPPV
jgi:hypothetical protein